MVSEKEVWLETKGRSSEEKGVVEDQRQLGGERKKISHFFILSGVNTSMVA